jgi:hypothetical protein
VASPLDAHTQNANLAALGPPLVSDKLGSTTELRGVAGYSLAAMRIYRGRREAGPPQRTRIFVADAEDGWSYDLVERPWPHTAGLEWGYAGAGPTNTARAILDDLLGEIPPWVGEFEHEIVAGLDPEFDLSAAEIRAWIAAREQE